MSYGRFRIVRTLWFEDMGLRNVQMFDTPFGRLSVRQLLIMAVFVCLGYIVSLFFEDILYKIVAGGTLFGGGFYLAVQKVRVVSPERSLLLALGFGRIMPRTAKREKTKLAGTKSKKTPSRRMMKVSADLESPVKIVGTLRDPDTGEILCGKPFEVFIRGVRQSSGISDDQGSFTAFFAPSMYGKYEVEIRPEGYRRGQVFTLVVEPKGGVKIV